MLDKRSFELFCVYSLLLIPSFVFSDSWSESTLKHMSLEEKVGQLFVGPICPMRGVDHEADWERLFAECYIGNGIVKQGDPASQIQILNRLQSVSKFPLLVAADYEWGLGMRMSNVISFPRNMTLGAIQTPGLIYQLGREIGNEARLVGVHINLAPVADVNNNPLNPVIHMRSFGEDVDSVSACVKEYILGLQAEGVFACAKHFPGHGDTTIDSHFSLPVLPQNRERLSEIELPPFQAAIDAGVALMMTGHLLVPAFDSHFPATLSFPIVQELLRDRLGFQGLVITDALNMKALDLPPEEVALLARKAGSDLLLYGAHLPNETDALMKVQIPRAYQALLQAYKEGALDLDELDKTVLKILKAKESLNLHQSRVVSLCDEVKPQSALELKMKLFQEAVTCIGEPKIPTNFQAAYLSINRGEADLLSKSFAKDLSIPGQLEPQQADEILDQLSHFENIIVAIHKVDFRDSQYGFSDALIELLEKLAPRAEGLLFATPYALRIFPFISNWIVGYEDEPEAQQAVINVMNGIKKPKGRLPTAIGLSKMRDRR